MKQRFDIHGATSTPLRAEPRFKPFPSTTGHIQGVEASSGGLVRSTIGAAAAATAILVLFWLPAEYGVDMTGLGRVMGLTQMGEIKQQLYAEAAAEDAALAEAGAAATVTATDPLALDRLAAIETQLAAIAAIVGAAPLAEQDTAAALAPASPPAEAVTAATPAPAVRPATAWRDEVSYTLTPGEGVEVKLVMDEGAVAEFEWSANGAVLNHDTHGDGSGQKITYEQGRGVPGEQGELVAAFSGNHGWFWRNRTDDPVTFTLRTRGDYAEMRAP